MSEQKNDTQNQTAAPAVTTPTEAPAPKLAAGLFQTYRLGATLEQAPHGNVIHGVKPNMMDYVKQAGSSKNQSMTSEELEKLDAKPAEVKKSAPAESKMDETIAGVPVEQREAVLAELDRRIEEAQKSNNKEELDRLTKAKDKAKKCYGPQMDQKQPKVKDLK